MFTGFGNMKTASDLDKAVLTEWLCGLGRETGEVLKSECKHICEGGLAMKKQKKWHQQGYEEFREASLSFCCWCCFAS